MKSPLVRFYYDNRNYVPGFIVIIGLSIVSGYIKSVSADYWGRTVDYGLVGQTDDMILSVIVAVLLILIDCIRTAFHYYIMGVIIERMFFSVRKKAFEKLTHVDMMAFEKNFSNGDIVVRLNNDIDLLSTFSSGNISFYLRMLFSALFALISCIMISWQLSIVYLLITPLSLLLAKWLSNPIRLETKKSMDYVGKAVSMVTDMLAGISTVKIFCAESFFEKKIDEVLKRKFASDIKVERAGIRLTATKYLTTILHTITLFLVGSWLISKQSLSVGSFISFITLSAYITDFLSQVDYMFHTIRRVSAGAQRYYEVLDIPNEAPGNADVALDNVPCKAESLSFAYEGESDVLRQLNIEINAGKKIAIVGSSGCGKSTFIKLICRLYLPKSGKLRLFGIETSDWNPDHLRSKISIVTQDPYLFDGSVFENISYGRPGLSREECESVLHLVNLWELISQWPDGIDHRIGEGGYTLSGGQKQRLCIARAIVKNAPLVILDEATSALDLENEREVQKALEKLLQGRSAIIIAHRLSTVQKVDYIYCMNEGSVIEEGTPDQLLKQKNFFYEMCSLQGILEVKE